MSDEAKASFTEALHKALSILTAVYDKVKELFVAVENWNCLSDIQSGIELLNACITNSHAASEGDWSIATANKTIATLCDAFSHCPLLETCVVELLRWNRSPDTLESALALFDSHWLQFKGSLLAQEEWTRLQVVTDARAKLAAAATNENGASTDARKAAYDALLKPHNI